MFLTHPSIVQRSTPLQLRFQETKSALKLLAPKDEEPPTTSPDSLSNLRLKVDRKLRMM